MEVLENILAYVVGFATLFVVGSVVGWVIEVFYRRLVSRKVWMNPGFMVGPYLPVYGFGTAALYALSFPGKALLTIPFFNENYWVYCIICVVAIAVILTLIEFIAGLIFIKGMNIKLWDYSKVPGNIMGIICPQYSIIWLVAGALYFFLIHPLLEGLLLGLSENEIFLFFFGIVLGCMIVDCCYSNYLASKISKFAKSTNTVINTEDLKVEKMKQEKAKNAENPSPKGKVKKGSFFVPVNAHDNFEELTAKTKK